MPRRSLPNCLKKAPPELLPSEVGPLLRLWILRAMVQLNGYRKFVQRDGFSNDDVAGALGLEQAGDKYDFEIHAVRKELRAMHRLAERQAGETQVPALLARNIGQLGQLIGLSDTEQRVLEFCILLHCNGLLQNAIYQLGEMDTPTMLLLLSTLLKLPLKDIRSTLSRRGLLLRSGLLSVSYKFSCHLPHRFHLISDDFADGMLNDDFQPEALLRGKVAPASPPGLQREDFSHLANDLDILLPYLRQALENEHRGVNILLHGPPGTGKSQLARILASEMCHSLFEVSSEDESGDPISGESRLRAMQVAQYFHSRQKSLLLFDEIEDVFNDGSIFRSSTAQAHKGWMNQVLETNTLPTLWLSNKIDGIDPAFIRRFDMVIEVPVPPKTQRECIARNLCGDLVDARTVARLAQSDKLSPAVVARAINVVRHLSKPLDRAEAGKLLQRLVDSTLGAQGQGRLLAPENECLPGTYDPALINADADLAQIAEMLAESRSARLCLYGAPGTGKTAYGRWLAEQLDMPLHIKRASELLGPHVGESEKNIASMFRGAERDGAVLMIDEVDSFLRERQRARSSWEISLVNEMLTQMETFPGIFVASTNMMDGLDAAALRRFDLKVKFDTLRSEQAAALLRRHGELLDFVIPDNLEALTRQHLHLLTPGDMATVMRQHRFRPLCDFPALFEALRAECALKREARPGIGFLANGAGLR